MTGLFTYKIPNSYQGYGRGYSGGRTVYGFVAGESPDKVSFHDLSTKQLRTMNKKSFTTRCTSFDYSDLPAGEQAYLDTINKDYKMQSAKTVQFKSSAIELISLADIGIGECIQTNSGHYLGVVSPDTSGEEPTPRKTVLHLESMTPMRITEVEQLMGVRKTINITVS